MKRLSKILIETDKVTKNVLKKCFEINYPEKEINIHDAMILGLLEDMIGKTKSLVTLIQNQDYNVLAAITRMIFESHIYLKFILDKETVNRASSYFFSMKIDEIKLFDSLIEQSLVGREIRKFLSIDRTKFLEQNSKHINEQYRRDVEHDYLKALNLKSKKDKWYNYNGKIRSFRDLCKHLNMEKEYVLLYKTFSKEIHSQEALKYFSFEKNMITVLEKQDNSELYTSSVSLFLIETVRAIYTYYDLYKDKREFNNILKLNYQIN
ncbi:hypothetical protein CHH83_20820 [Bacillus sp. 7586-K]|nr:hypothetical protein CHH83_20820 [Bacillus sp. 7586-K]